MKKILLTAINSKYVHTNLALLYLQSLTLDFTTKYQTKLIELNINNHNYDILSEIVAENPDIIAISTYIWNTTIVKQLLPDIAKVLPRSLLVLGGPEVSFNCEGWLTEFPQIDYIITGGGEAGWLKLLTSGFKYPKKVITTPNPELDDIPFPYNETTIDNLKSRIVYYESSRGCPFRCSFCLSSRQDCKLEYRDLDKVKKELDYFISRKVPLVKFIDRTFNANPKHYRAIWDYIITHNRATRFHFEINPFLLSDEDMELLQKVPPEWFQFEMGIQSTNHRTLNETNRAVPYSDSPVVAEQVKDRIKILQKNIHTHLDLVFGLPYEGYTEAITSFNEVYQLKADNFQAGMLKVLPGTIIYERAEEYGMTYQSEPPYRILQNRWISFHELNKLYRIEHLVNNLYNSHKFDRTLDYLVEFVGSPFELFEKLERFWQAKGINYWLKDWNKTAMLVIDFTYVISHKEQGGITFLPLDDRSSNGSEAIIYDCLRWDLWFNTGITEYPSFLIDEPTRLLLEYWIKTKKCRKIPGYSDSITNSILKSRKLIVYKPVSNEFRERYNIGENDYFLVYKDLGINKSIKLSYEELLDAVVS